jgi:NAD(P)-dependent dehydrogenase (short-subunit alcohol dehydrogenase family)
MKLNDQTVVVIGGTSGIGFAVAQRAHAEGARVIVASSNPINVEKAVQRLPSAKGVPIDVKDEASVERGLSALGRLDHVIFTAGDWGVRRLPLVETDLADARSNLPAVRFWGAATVIKHAAKHMGPNGSITFTNGLMAHRPSRGSSVATAMSGALEFLARGLAVELAPVRVNCVCSGFMRTDIWNSIPEDRREDQLRQFTARQPLPRVGEVEEIAEAYIFAMRCGYMTGQILHIDGGATIV